MEYKDYLGIPINPGDFVVAATNRGSLEKCIVIGYTPTMVRTSCGLYGPKYCMVANEQLQISGQQVWMDAERLKYQDKLDHKIEKPKISWRYLVGVFTDTSTGNKVGCVLKLDGTTIDRFKSARQEWVKNRGYNPDTAYYLQHVYKGYKAVPNGYIEEFDRGYSRYDKGDSLATIKIHGMQDCIDNPMPLDQFMVAFPTFNLDTLRKDGKI